MRGFIVAILLVGILRFILTVSGFPDSFVKFFSMTVVIMIGTIYFAIATETHKDRLKASFLLILPYMIIEVAALGYTWATGQQTIFHAPEYSFGGTPLLYHWIGHFVGGLTWEPLSVFVVMELIWLIIWPIKWALRPKTTEELPS
jgi:hypothetical protein